MQNKGFAKYININGKFKAFKDEKDIIELQNKEIERLENIRIKAIEYAKDSGYNISNNMIIDILEGDVINEAKNNN